MNVSCCENVKFVRLIAITILIYFPNKIGDIWLLKLFSQKKFFGYDMDWTR